MALTYEQYSKLCDAEKYFKRLYKDTERYIYFQRKMLVEKPSSRPLPSTTNGEMV